MIAGRSRRPFPARDPSSGSLSRDEGLSSSTFHTLDQTMNPQIHFPTASPSLQTLGPAENDPSKLETTPLWLLQIFSVWQRFESPSPPECSSGLTVSL